MDLDSRWAWNFSSAECPHGPEQSQLFQTILSNTKSFHQRNCIFIYSVYSKYSKLCYYPSMMFKFFSQPAMAYIISLTRCSMLSCKVKQKKVKHSSAMIEISLPWLWLEYAKSDHTSDFWLSLLPYIFGLPYWYYYALLLLLCRFCRHTFY